MRFSMAWREAFDQALNIDLRSLSVQSLGLWPIWAKALATIGAFGLVVGCGYLVFLAGGAERLDAAKREAEQLRHDHQRQAARVANLPGGEQGSEPAQDGVSPLDQLPRNSDIPTLLEDIARAAQNQGLSVRGIEVMPELAFATYAEVPLRISVWGGYHDIGAFIGEVAAMRRLVTLHDFELALVDDAGLSGGIRLDALAKAYWRLGPEVRSELLASIPPAVRFAYRGDGRRNPFEPPILGRLAKESETGMSVAPDTKRPRHYLERYALDRLAMVGTLSEGTTPYALVRDETHQVHRLGVGHYLGHDHGRIREITLAGMDIVEIVPDGAGGWVQRARTLSMGSSRPDLEEE